MNEKLYTNTHIFTNRDGNTLIKEFEGVLRNNNEICRLDAVVGFMRASGYFALRPFLNSINKARVLIGINADKYISRAVSDGLRFFGAEKEVKKEVADGMQRDIEGADYRKEVEDGIELLKNDLKEGKLELRAHPSKSIHAKIYVLYPEEFNQYTGGMLITGSSNLSGNGLGTGKAEQYEFNVKLTQFEDVLFAKEEFEKLWAEAQGVQITADDINEVVNKTYLKGDVAPYDLYIKMLMEYFPEEVLNTDQNNPLDIPSGYSRYEYQIDAVIEGYQKLLRYDGFFLADVVGLGKTVVATMIAKKFLIENGREKTKILVVSPPAITSNWKSTFRDFDIDKYTKFVNNSEQALDKVLNRENDEYWNAGDYDLILVDEAHKFRKHDTKCFKNLQNICKMPRNTKGNLPGTRKKVMLISATPLNNTPKDLLNQILLFQDARCCTIEGVSNLNAFFSPLIEEFKNSRKNPEADTKEFKDIAERLRESIIKPLTVRRTRTDIESIPRYRKDVQAFPKVDPPVENSYELNDQLATLFERAMQILANDLTYARYKAIEYLKPEVARGKYENPEMVSRSLASIRKNSLVKRLESSFHAFKISLNRFSQANRNMLEMFKNNKVYIMPDADVNKCLEEKTEEEMEAFLEEKSKKNPKNASFCADDFNPQFFEMLQRDQSLLDEMCDDWDQVSDADDSKFERFEQLLKGELFHKERNPEQKLVVFSEARDTIEYLKKRIGRDDVLTIAADNRKDNYKIIRENFDANWKEKKNEYNIILTTNVLAEGVNLHRSNIIVNYDTPWNSTRLMQRIGRVNRIGSKSKHIYNYVFYPSRQGNKEINLNQIVLSKIQTFHTIFGEDNQVYSHKEILERVGKLFDEAIKAEKEELNMENIYREELRTLYQTNRSEYNRIKALSLRCRTGRKSQAIDGVTLSKATLVFLKTNFRKAFYLVSKNAEELSVLNALKYFKAAVDEKAVARVNGHHQQVQMALEQFAAKRSEKVRDWTYEEQKTRSLGGETNMARSLLKILIKETTDSNIICLLENLLELVERGTISSLPSELNKIYKGIRRKEMNDEQCRLEVLDIAKQYQSYWAVDENKPSERETEPVIILSESFQ